ncbi:zinc finger protein 182-like isoform X2 [Wyeomyia smithii]|nr:zinc finger protein 182-like isoform X2 [Wyeomyia smithii]
MDPEVPMLCRLCLQSNSPLSMVLLNQNEGFVKAIFHITSVEAIMDVTFDVYMCTTCQNLLEQCIQFRTTCLCNDVIFRKTYVKHTGEIELKPNTCLKDGVVKMEIEMEPLIEELKYEAESNADSDYKPERDTDGTLSADDTKPSVIEIKEKVRKKRGRKPRTKDSIASKSKPKNTSHKVQCQICGKMVANTNLAAHQQIHDPNRPKLACPHCPAQYTESKRLKLHINNKHTHEVQFSCDRCGKTFASPDSLRVHYIALHTDIKKYECTLCGEKFSRSTSRRHHYKMVHTTIRPYECEYCERTFKFKCDLTLHTRTHTGEKPFECDICHKTFNKSYNVVIHKKSHQNEIERAAEKAMKIVQNSVQNAY